MKNNSDINLSSKIKSVLLLYFKTQFVLVLVTILLVWGIMYLVPNLHIIYEVFIVIFSYIILSQIMDYLISPYLIGQKVKTSPIFLFVSFMLGISLMGFLGAFLAVPLALILKTVWEHYSKN